MYVFLDPNARVPLYLQLYEAIKREIESGRLRAGEKLPSIRALAQELKVSKQTVDTALQQLLAEGYVESRPRSGLYVLPIDEEWRSATSPPPSAPLATFPDEADIDFYYGAIDLEKFPLKIWKRCLTSAADSLSEEVFYYGNRQGDLFLREEIRKHVFQARGIACTVEQIFICSGTVQSIHFLTRLLQLSNQRVAMEDPGYAKVRYALRERLCKVIPIPLEEDGICLAELQQSGAKAVYVTPSHQFPLGMVLPIRKRLELLRWAEEHGSFIFEDDYDSEFRYMGKPIPSLKSLDTSDRVIYCGTFSKNFLPALRCSYVILPEKLAEKGRESLEYLTQSCSPLLQRALALFMRDGHFAKHVRRMKAAYQAKHKTLMKAVQENLGERVEIIGQKAGLHILLDIGDRNAEDLTRRAKQKGVRIYSPARHWAGEHPGSYVMLGFGGLSEKQIQEGIRIFAEVFAQAEACSKFSRRKRMEKE